MELLRKYGVQTDIYFPLIVAGSNDFAGSGDYTYAAGDIKISKDGGAAANPTNSPSAIAMGNAAKWKLTLTATEMQAAKIDVVVSDAATKAVEDQMLLIATYGNASAEHAADLDDATSLGLSRLDAAISSRLATAGYTVPDNASIAAILADTGTDLPATLATIAGYIDTEIAAILAAIGTPSVDLAADIAAVLAKATDTETDTQDIQARLPASLVGGRIDAYLGASGTDVLDAASFDATVGQEFADALLDRANAIETGWTARMVLRILAAAVAGKLSGAATATNVIRSIIDAKDRITATVDADGNRSNVTLDGS